jgi:hypothetical protein
MRVSRQLQVSAIALVACMLLLGRVFSLIHPGALALVAVAALVARRGPRYRRVVEVVYLIGLPLYCAWGVFAASSINDVGPYVAVGVCGSIYGLIWFGMDSGSAAPLWIGYSAAVPVSMLAGFWILLQSRYVPLAFHGTGLGSHWIVQALCAVAVVVGVALWRPVQRTGVWSFGAAVTLCMTIRVFQNLNQAAPIDITLAFFPYIAAMIATSASIPSTRNRVQLTG